MRTIVKILLIAGILLSGFACALYFAPRYLIYSTDCAKADAVVVLLGPDFNARYRHACNLINKGMADYLVVPAYKRIYGQNAEILQLQTYPQDDPPIGKAGPPWITKYYEDTHLELLEAKRVVLINGYRKIIFVSSPYHMRRIRVMVNKEFDASFTACFSPTPYDPAPDVIWELKASDWKKIRREYTKILWFMIYSPLIK